MWSPRWGVIALLLAAVLAAQVIMRRDVAATVDHADQRAPLRLAETGLYREGRLGEVDPRNRPYSPQYPLWSDGAAKARWVSLPSGTAIDASDAAEWRFPVGTRFWKEFTFNGRKVETRMLWRAATGRWVFASYVWNETGTDAVLAPEAGMPNVAEVAPGRHHSIPSVVECRACHESRQVEPLGFNALQLSTDRDPLAIHGEPLAPGMITLQTLHDEGWLSPARPELVARPPRIQARTAATRAVLGYLAANCGACHNRDGEIAALIPSLDHADLTREGESLARAMVRHKTAWQVPGVPDGQSVLIDPEAPDASAVLARMRSRRPSSQMPPLGTVVADREALDAITRWIAGEASDGGHGRASR